MSTKGLWPFKILAKTKKLLLGQENCCKLSIAEAGLSVCSFRVKTLLFFHVLICVRRKQLVPRCFAVILCNIPKRGGCLGQDIGMACWDRLTTSGIYLCLSPWGFLEKSGGCTRHPANLFYLFHPWAQLQLWGVLHPAFEMQRLDQSQRKIQWAVKHKHICPQLVWLDKAKLPPVKLCGVVAAEELAQ